MKKNILLDSLVIVTYVLIFVVFIVMFGCTASYGQNLTNEQLQAKANGTKNSTEKVYALNQLCWENRITNEENAIKYGLEAIKCSESIKFYPGLATAYINLAYIYTRQNKYDEAMDAYSKAVKALDKVYDAKKKKVSTARVYEGLGLINYMEHDYPKSLESYQKALRLFKEAALKNNVALCYRIIGMIYDKTGNKRRASESYYMELKTVKNTNIKNDSISSYLDFERINEE